MMQLSLFPLNSVLFPGMPLRLRIFEARYKEMINECIEQEKPFGVVLIQKGREALGTLAKPHKIGTTAHISDVQRLPLGEMNILAIGGERFKINHLDRDSRSFLMGDIELLSSLDMNEQNIQKYVASLRHLLIRYLKALSAVGQITFDSEHIPQNATALAYLGAILMQEDNEQKQAILELTNSKSLFQTLLTYYKREVSIIQLLSSPPIHDDEHDFPFSLN